MTRYILRTTDLNILNLLKGIIEFQPGLNLISGENGTLKTKLLQQIRGGSFTKGVEATPRIQAVSPKRNAERRNLQAIVQMFRQQNRKLADLINERQINDQTFDPYPSLAELYYLVFEDRCKDGERAIDKMNSVTEDFNKVVTGVFPEAKLVSRWNRDAGTPEVELQKSHGMSVPVESLSLGEQEILSLLINLYASRERYEVYLIDEPEVHLNWHLEESLFDYLHSFCEEYDKQMIVVTHSRAIFKPEFLERTQFLYWNESGTISVGTQLTDDQRRRLAGEAVHIVQIGQTTKPTFFVEDRAHRTILKALIDVIGAEALISECGNSPNLKSLFRLSQTAPGWERSYFISDGDNEGNPFPGEPRFVHLDKYCLENYLIDIPTAARASTKSETDIRSLLLESIRDNKDRLFRKTTFFRFLIGFLAEEHMTDEHLRQLDASAIMRTFTEKIGLRFKDYAKKYIEICANEGRLQQVFPPRLIELLEAARTPILEVAEKAPALESSPACQAG